MGVDFKNQAPDGRGSIRVESKEAFNQVMIIADIEHVPSGACGIWPAL